MGNNNDGSVTRSLLYFDLGSNPGPNVSVSESHVAVLNFASPACNSPRSMDVYGLGGPFGTATTWNSQPPLDGAGVVSTSAPFALGANGCAGAYVNLDTTSLARRWMSQASPKYGLELRATDENDWFAYEQFYSDHAGNLNVPILTVNYA